jgi:hypothetical protein
LLCLVSWDRCEAGPVPAFSMEQLERDSEVIVVVRPSTAENTYSVVTVLRGNIKAGTSMQFADHSLPAVGVDVDLLVFAKRNPKVPSQYILSSEYYGVVRIAKDAAGRHAEPSERIEAYLLAGLESKDPDVVSDSVIWARYLQAPRLFEKITRIVQDSEKPAVPIEAAFLEAKVPSGDEKTLKRAIAFVDGAGTDPKNGQYRSWVVWSFSKIHSSSNINIAYLNGLLSRTDYVSKAVAFSAVEWADNSSVGALSTILESADNDVAYRGVIALSKLLHHSGPSYTEFMKDAPKYKGEWKKRAEAHRAMPARTKVPSSEAQNGNPVVESKGPAKVERGQE